MTNLQSNQVGIKVLPGTASASKSASRAPQDISLSFDGSTLLPLCDMAGYACFVTWAFTIGWYGNPSLIGAGAESDLFLLRLSLFAGVAVASFALLFVGGRFLRSFAHRSPWAVVPAPLVGALCASPTLVFELPFGASLVLWFLAGLGQLLFFYLWGARFRILSHRQQLYAVCGAFVVAGISLALLPFVDLVIVRWLVIALPVASAALMVCARYRFSGASEQGCVDASDDPEAAVESDDSDDSGRRHRLKGLLKKQIPFEKDRRHIVLKGLFAGLYSVSLGFATCVSLTQALYFANDVAIGFGNIVAAVFMLSVPQGRERDACNILPKLFLPVTSFCYLFIAVLWPTEGVLVCVFALFFLFSCYEILNAYTAYAYTAHDSARCLWELQSSKTGNSIGFFVGWLVAVLMPTGSDSETAGLLTVCFLMVSLAAVVDTFFFKEMKLEFHEIVVDDEPVLEVRDPKLIEALPSVRGRFSRACDELAEEYRLSPRQKEIFLLLSKGRNVQYIKDKLVLSTPTVKSHVYNIYQKMSIHSHQELLDLIEKRVSDEKRCHGE